MHLWTQHFGLSSNDLPALCLELTTGLHLQHTLHIGTLHHLYN